MSCAVRPRTMWPAGSSRQSILPVAGEPKHYPIAFNAIPQIDVFDEDDYTKEEWKMVRETQKLFKDPSLKHLSRPAVRIPVMRSHSESINVETVSPLSPEECRALLRHAPGVRTQSMM
jgi:aspartate-semialdehyde dehydrogenase